MTFLHCPGTVS